MDQFKPGDIVIYNVRQKRDMQHWRHLNGIVGIVVEIVDDLDENRGQGARVAWLTQISKQDFLDDVKPYPNYLLEKVGEICLSSDEGI